MRRHPATAPSMPPCRLCRPALSGIFAMLIAAAAFGQGEPKYVGWPKVEAARETREVKERLREGSFDGDAKQYFLTTVLPQISFDENRSTIERTRRRMRELLLTDVGDEKAFTEATRTVADFMNALSRNDNAEPVVRVNAMLLVGELKSKEGKPWPPAAPVLAATAGDASLPTEVRIAAMAGVVRHVEAVKSDPAALAAVARTGGPAVQAILAEPLNPSRRNEQEWLASRALSVLPLLVPAAPKDLAALLARIVEDGARSVDTRVRAAAAIGATANAASGVDAQALVQSIRRLAIQMLEADESAAAARRFERELAGVAVVQPAGQQPAIGFGTDLSAPQDPTAIPEQACRRDAWRLSMLADAILSADGKTGLARLLPDAAGPPGELAVVLRNGAGSIDQTPNEQSVLDVLAAVRPPAAVAPATKPAIKPKEERPAAEPAPEPNASPFDNPL